MSNKEHKASNEEVKPGLIRIVPNGQLPTLKKWLLLSKYLFVGTVFSVGIVALLAIFAVMFFPGDIDSLEQDFLSIAAGSRIDYAKYVIEITKSTWSKLLDFWGILLLMTICYSILKVFYPKPEQSLAED